jgi:hypothetical protein
MADSDNVLDGDETFECPQCGIMYRGSYKIGIGIARGCFDCLECKSPVHSWQGVRDYVKWDRI